MFKLLMPLLSPEGPPSGGGASGTGLATPSGPAGQGKEDIIEFLGDGSDEETLDLTPQVGKGKGKEKGKEEGQEEDETPPAEDESDSEGDEESEEIDELAELEAELQEPSEEQLELVTPVRRRDILKKYPNIFKDFPYLEKAYYREQQFTELLPTIDDAKQAVEAKQVLDNFERDLMSGKTETVLAAVKAQDPNAFNKIVDDYMMSLKSVDEGAYFHVLGNLTKHTIFTMVQEARRTNNEQLQSAAHILNQFIFGTSDWQPPTNLSKQERPEDRQRNNQQNERELAYTRQQFENTRGDLNSKVNNTLRNTIAAHIDPRQSMTDYVRGNASRDALETLETLINRDTRFKALVDKLWDNAYKNQFSRDAVDKIKSAYLSKAKTLLPSVIKKARNEALRGMGKRVSADATDESTPRKGPIPAGRPRSQTPNAGKIKEAKDIPRGMRTIDFLNAD